MLSKHPQTITDRHGRHWVTVKGRLARYMPMEWWTVPAGSKANPKSCGTTIRERDRILNDLPDSYVKDWANQLED